MDTTQRKEFIELVKKLNLEEREAKMLWSCLEYSEDPYGSPNHLLMVLVAKLWFIAEDLSEEQEGIK